MASTRSVTQGSQCKQELLHIASAYLAQADEQRAARSELLQPLMKALGGNVFRLVVMGEVKKGKSSFINALLGQTELLPIDIDIATSTVFKIVYGERERITVFYYDDEEEEEDAASEKTPRTEVIDRARLSDFGTEGGNPKNAKQVDFIAIELPHALLADGLVIVDTPGVGGLFKRHREVTFRYAPQADVVLFVLDSVEAVLSEDETRFLRELQKNTQQIVFLQTKIDIAGAEQSQAWKERNLAILSDVLQVPPATIPYFLVGAKQKELADRRGSLELLQKSGYLAVTKHIQEHLVPQRDEILTRRWLPIIEPDLLRSAQQVCDRLAIARNTQPPELAELEQKLADSERAFNHWQNDVWPQQFRSFQERTAGLRRDIRNQLQDELSLDSPECLATLDELRRRCLTVNEVNQFGNEVLSDLAAGWNRQATRTLEEFRRSYQALCADLIGNIAAELEQVEIPAIEVEPGQMRGYNLDATSMLRDTWMTYSALHSISTSATKTVAWSAALSVVAGILTAPVGLTISAVAATGFVAAKIWATVRGYSVARERHRDAAMAILERAVGKTAIAATKAAIRSFEDLSAELESASRKEIDLFRASARNEITVRKQECQQARTRSVTEAKAAEDQLRAALAQHQDLLKKLQLLKEQLSASVTR